MVKRGDILISSHREEELQALWLAVNNSNLSTMKDYRITYNRESKQLHYNRKGVVQRIRCDNPFILKLYNKSYFEAARRLKKRSLLYVNEHFSDKADAERALLDDFTTQ